MRLSSSYGDHCALIICGPDRRLGYSSVAAEEEDDLRRFMKAQVDAHGISMYRNCHHEDDEMAMVGDELPPAPATPAPAPSDSAPVSDDSVSPAAAPGTPSREQGPTEP